MHSVRLFLGAALVAALSGNALAQDPISARQAAMKEIGRNFGTVNRMNRGQTPYDGAAAAAAFTAIATAAEKFSPLFPEDSKTGGDTEAAPAIWENKADFDAKVAKFVTDAKTAAAEAGKGEDAFKAIFTSVGPSCSGCHKPYRVQ